MKKYCINIYVVLATLCLPQLSVASGVVPEDSVALCPATGFRALESVVLPYGGNIDKSLTTGSSSSWNGDALNRYPTSDIRLALNGIIPGLAVTEKSGMTGGFYGFESDRCTVTSRGFSMTMIVDGMPVSAYEVQLDPEEIESVSILRDVVDKARFGARASGGVIYVTTKRGRAGHRNINVGVESGVSVIGRMPEWVSGVDYANLQNQALEASGRPAIYSEADIEAFAALRPDDLYHPNVDWRSLMYKKTKSYRRASVSLSGGSEAVRYAICLGYLGEGDIYRLGKDAEYNRANIRANLDVRITPTLGFKLGVSSNLAFRTSPVCGSVSTDVINEFDRFITATNTTPSVAFPIHLGVNSENGGWIYGVSERYPSSPYAALVERGFTTMRSRSGIINGTLSWDARKLLKGLSFASNFGFDVLNMDRIGKNPDYLAMIYNPQTGESLKTAHEGAKVSGKSNYGKWYHQRLFFNERAEYNLTKGEHRLNAAAMYYLEMTERSGSSLRERQQTAIVSADYSFGKRYLLQVTLNTTGSSMFRKGNRFGFFPSAGLGWVISEEKFLKDSRNVNLLKIKAQYGKTAYNPFGSQNLYEDSYSSDKAISFGPASQGFEWLGSYTRYASYATTLKRLGNSDLTWEDRRELSVGFETAFFENRLSVNADYYYILRDGIITDISSVNPLLYGMDGVSTYANYNKASYSGGEISVNWTDRIGKFEYSVGGWLLIPRGRWLRYSENEINSYNRVEGSAIGSYHGYRCIGKFESEEEIASSPVQAFDSKVEVGDLKYADLNGDNKIDSNDLTIVGNTSARYVYSVNIFLKYGKFDLTAVGVGRAGFDTPLTNSYFWNGWGTDNYSAFVRDNVGGAYPRLSYDKLTNNFQKSDFWLRKGGWFKIKNVELGCTLNFRDSRSIRGLRIFLRGTNLCTISSLKDVDPESIDSGVTTDPLFRTFTGGVKLNF